MSDKISTRLKVRPNLQSRSEFGEDNIAVRDNLAFDFSARVINRCKICGSGQAIKVEIEGLGAESLLILICRSCFQIEEYFEKAISYPKDELPFTSIIYQITNLDILMKMTEIFFVERAVESANGNKSEAARILGISIRTMFYKLKNLKKSKQRLANFLEAEEFQLFSQIKGDLSTKLSVAERYYCRTMIVLCRGDKAKAAYKLGISPRTMRYKTSQFGL